MHNFPISAWIIHRVWAGQVFMGILPEMTGDRDFSNSLVNPRETYVRTAIFVSRKNLVFVTKSLIFYGHSYEILERGFDDQIIKRRGLEKSTLRSYRY